MRSLVCGASLKPFNGAALRCLTRTAASIARALNFRKYFAYQIKGKSSDGATPLGPPIGMPAIEMAGG